MPSPQPRTDRTRALNCCARLRIAAAAVFIAASIPVRSQAWPVQIPLADPGRPCLHASPALPKGPPTPPAKAKVKAPRGPKSTNRRTSYAQAKTHRRQTTPESLRYERNISAHRTSVPLSCMPDKGSASLPAATAQRREARRSRRRRRRTDASVQVCRAGCSCEQASTCRWLVSSVLAAGFLNLACAGASTCLLYVAQLQGAISCCIWLSLSPRGALQAL